MMTKNKPNVILVIIDALRAKEFYFPDGKKPNTPFLDRLAKSSYVYTRGIAPSTWTLPSCASIFTGLLPTEHGLNFANSKLKSGVRTFAEVMSRNGYRTVCFSGQPLINYENGIARGFDELYNFYKPVELPFKKNVLDLKKLKLPQDKGILEIIQYILESSLSEGNVFKNLINMCAHYNKSLLGFFMRDKGAKEIIDAAINWIKSWQSSEDSPSFFLYIHLMETHEMYFPFAFYNILYSILNIQRVIKYLKSVRITHFTSRNLVEHYYFEKDVIEYLRGLYKREIEYLDKKLNLFYKFLKSQGLDNETVFIITADHGQQLYEHRALGHAMRFYNVNLHVPLLIRLPEAEFKTINRFISLKDLPATVADYLGFGNETPGHSFLPNKMDKYPPYVLSETIADPIFDIKMRNKNITNELDGLNNKIISEYMYGGLSVYYDKFHYILLTNGRREVYDFENDYNERTNLLSIGVKELPNSILRVVEKEFLKLKIANMLRRSRGVIK